MSEPWSIAATHPTSGEPIGIVINDNSTFLEAKYIAQRILTTFRLTGAYLSTHEDNNTQGHYLLTYTISPSTYPRLATIWAECLQDAQLRLDTLAVDGVVLMLS